MSDVDKQLKKTGQFWYCRECKARGFLEGYPLIHERKEMNCESCASERIEVAGPLYTGKLFDTPFIEKMLSFETSEKTKKFLQTILEESGVDGIAYNLHELSLNRKTEAVVKELRAKGYSTSKTHYGGHFIRSDGPVEKLQREHE